MIVYSLTYFINAIGVYVNKRSSKGIKIVVLLLLVFISGTRYYMGGLDVYTYENVYNEVPSIDIVLQYFLTGVGSGINENYEVGFLLLCAACRAFHLSYFGFILAYTIIFYTLMVKGLKDFVPNWGIYFAVFMYKIMFYDTFISIRQGLTIAMFCFMLRYIRDRKWYVYFPLCYLAFLEHRGALILFPLYFITYLPTSKRFVKWYGILWAPTWLFRSRVDLSSLITSITDFIQNDHAVEHWLDSTERISIIHTLECYIVFILLVFFYNKIISNKREKEVRLVIQLFLITIPIFTLFSNWILFTREKDYFVLMYGILFGFLLDKETNTEWGKRKAIIEKNNFIILSLTILIACYIGMFRYCYSFDNGELMQFRSFLFEGGAIFDWS